MDSDEGDLKGRLTTGTGDTAAGISEDPSKFGE